MKRIVRNTSSTEPLLLDTFKEFIDSKRYANLAEASIRDYEESFRRFISFFQFNDSTELSIVNEVMFKEWALDMLNNDLKIPSINRYLRDCKVFINWSYKNNYLQGNPPTITLMKTQQESPKAFPYEDILAITAKPQNKDDFVEYRNWVITNYVLATGNRASTIIELQIQDIDFRNREINLRHTKNKKAQVIPLSSSLETILKEYFREWRHEAEPTDYVFPNIANEQLTRDAMIHSFIKYCRKRGSSHTNIHGLRHTFALNWIRAGGNQFKLQKILGHSSLEMTKRYVTLVSDDLKEDFDKFSTLDNIRKAKKPKKLINKNEVV